MFSSFLLYCITSLSFILLYLISVCYILSPETKSQYPRLVLNLLLYRRTTLRSSSSGLHLLSARIVGMDHRAVVKGVLSQCMAVGKHLQLRMEPSVLFFEAGRNKGGMSYSSVPNSSSRAVAATSTSIFEQFLSGFT